MADQYSPLPNPGHTPSGRVPRICIATWEIEGPSRNGGIGTAYTSLAEASRRAGHEVTILYLLGSFCANGNIVDWADHYREVKGVRLVPLPLPPDPRIHAGWAASVSYHTYNWLRSEADNFDIVHFPECQGIGFYSLAAKRQGLAFQNSTFVISTHGPTLWVKESGQDFLNNLGELEIDHLERASVALADYLTSPSRYLLGWMKAKGWSLPSDIYLAPYIMPENIQAGREQAATTHPGTREFVFFGRLELRKGLKMFCDALDALSIQFPNGGFEVTFLGKETMMYGRSSIGYISDRSRNWTMPWRVVANLGQAAAMRYLKKPGRMAVIASLVDNYPNTVLECIGAGVPFIATSVGGIPEIIAAEDHPRVCFEPTSTALARRICDVLEQGGSTARPAWDLRRTEESWVNWHASLLAEPARPKQTPRAEQPLVSLCFPYDVASKRVPATLETLARQSYAHLEVILVQCGVSEIDQSAVARLTDARIPCRACTSDGYAMGHARNAAVAAAAGRYVMFVDDNTLLRDPNAVATFVAVAEMTAADAVTSTISFYIGSSESRIEHSRRPFLGGDLASGAFTNCFGSTNALIRRDAFEQLGPFTHDAATTLDDWEFFSKAALAGLRIETIADPLIWYREDEEPEAVVHSYANAVRSTAPYSKPGQSLSPAAQSAIGKSLLLAQGLKFERDVILGTSLGRGEQGPAVIG